MSDFIKLKSGYTINPAAISIINLTKPDKATIHVGSSALDFEGDDAKALHKEFGMPPDGNGKNAAKPAPGAPTHEPEGDAAKSVPTTTKK